MGNRAKLPRFTFSPFFNHLVFSDDEFIYYTYGYTDVLECRMYVAIPACYARQNRIMQLKPFTNL